MKRPHSSGQWHRRGSPRAAELQRGHTFRPAITRGVGATKIPKAKVLYLRGSPSSFDRRIYCSTCQEATPAATLTASLLSTSSKASTRISHRLETLHGTRRTSSTESTVDEAQNRARAILVQAVEGVTDAEIAIQPFQSEPRRGNAAYCNCLFCVQLLQAHPLLQF